MGFQRHAYRRRSCSLGGWQPHANTFSDPNRDSYANSNGNCNGNAYSELHAEVSTDAAAAPDAGTSTVMNAGLVTESFLPARSPE